MCAGNCKPRANMSYEYMKAKEPGGNLGRIQETESQRELKIKME